MRDRRRGALILALAFAGFACGASESEVTGAPMAAPDAQEKSASGNRAPQIEELTLSPRSPRPGETVTAEVRASDPDGDVVLLSYAWRVNGAVAPSQGASLRVTGERGTEIEVEVTPRDEKSAGASETSSARVGNQPPVLLSLRVQSNQEIAAGMDLVVEPQVNDPDGDEVELEYQWYVNDERVETASGPALPAKAFKSGDRIRVSVVASDGLERSDPLEAEPMEVGNEAPRITSTVPESFDADGVYRYQIAVEDADSKVFRYRLLEGPPGMELDPLDGRLVWAPTEDQEGKHPVKVEARDARGATATQSFAIDVKFSTEEVPAPASGSAAPAAPAS